MFNCFCYKHITKTKGFVSAFCLVISAPIHYHCGRSNKKLI